MITHQVPECSQAKKHRCEKAGKGVMEHSVNCSNRNDNVVLALYANKLETQRRQFNPKAVSEIIPYLSRSLRS